MAHFCLESPRASRTEHVCEAIEATAPQFPAATGSSFKQKGITYGMFNKILRDSVTGILTFFGQNHAMISLTLKRTVGERGGCHLCLRLFPNALKTIYC